MCDGGPGKHLETRKHHALALMQCAGCDIGSTNFEKCWVKIQGFERNGDAQKQKNMSDLKKRMAAIILCKCFLKGIAHDFSFHF